MASTTSKINTAVDTAQNEAGDILNYSSMVSGETMPQFEQYLSYLDKMTSGSPTERMEAIAPTVSDATAVAQGQKKQLAGLPRGGEKAMLSASIDQQTAATIGRALSKAFTQAEEFKKEVGALGISTYLQGAESAGGLELGSANVLTNLLQIQDQNQQQQQAGYEQMAEQGAQLAAEAMA